MTEHDPFASMTVAQVEALVKRLADAAQVFRDSQSIFGGRGATVGLAATQASPAHPHATAAAPYPCHACQRTAPESPGELVQAEECRQCGNRLPGGAIQVKPRGPPTRTIGGFSGFDPHEEAERQRLMRLNKGEDKITAEME